MLGPNLLIAPVFAASGEVEFYVPESQEDGDAEWTDLLSGKQYVPGKWYSETHGFLSLPILVRPNALLVRNTKVAFPEEDISSGGLEVVYGQLTKEVSVTVYTSEGKDLGTFKAVPDQDGNVAVEGQGVKGESRRSGVDA